MSSRRLLPAMALLAIAASAAFLLSGRLTSQAVQSPTISLDMVTTGTAYDDTTNTMTVGTIDSSSTGSSNITHTHATQLVINNVEDLVGWQVRLNYIGDRLRPQGQNITPFTDNNTLQNVGFTNLPIDQTTLIHRDVTSAASIPAAPPDNTNTPQTALVGGTYNATQTFPISPDTPAKAVPDDSSYAAPSGGVLSQLNLSVVGNECNTGPMLMDLDDDNPNPPGSGVAIFNGVGITDVHLAESALFDGTHTETGGVCGTPSPTATVSSTPTPCVFPDCTPSPSPSPSPSPTPTATATATPTATATATVCAGCSFTPTPSRSPTPTPSATLCPVCTPTATATATATAAAGTLVTYTNQTGVTANDLHFYTQQGSMTLTVEVVTNAPGCAAPTTGAGTTTGLDFTFAVSVVWPSTCVDSGESVTLRLNCGSPGCYSSPYACSDWTLNGSQIGSPCPTPNCAGQPCCGGLPCPTPTATASPCGVCTGTPTPVPTPTPTPTPVQFHDASINRLRTVHYVRLAPGVPDTANTTVVVGQSNSNHTDAVSVYLAFNPPGGFSTNPGGCSVFVAGATGAEQASQVYNWTRITQGLPSVTLLPGQKVTLSGSVDFVCANPAAVNGLNWEVKAFADAHADDSASCDTLAETFGPDCSVALNDDDDADANNTLTRAFPKVVAQ